VVRQAPLVQRALLVQPVRRAPLVQRARLAQPVQRALATKQTQAEIRRSNGVRWAALERGSPGVVISSRKSVDAFGRLAVLVRGFDGVNRKAGCDIVLRCSGVEQSSRWRGQGREKPGFS
jgi:hypothetical protein